jgi:hypothetical protein
MAFLNKLVLVGLVCSACAAGPHAESVLPAPGCTIVVFDRTPHALQIRLGIGAFTSGPIGALNPGELLTYSVPCAQGSVWITGIPIPSQVGAPVSFSSVGGWTALVPGGRAQIALEWP